MNMAEDPTQPSVSFEKNQDLFARTNSVNTGFDSSGPKETMQKYRKATMNTKLAYALKEKDWDEIQKDENLAENSVVLSQYKDSITQCNFKKDVIADYKKKLKFQEEDPQKDMIRFSTMETGDEIYRMHIQKRICMYLKNNYWLRMNASCNSFQGLNFISMSPSIVYNHDKQFVEAGYEISKRNNFYIDMFYRINHQNQAEKDTKNQNTGKFSKYLDRIFEYNRQHSSIIGMKFVTETHEFSDIQNSLSFYYSFNQVFKSYVTFNALHQLEGSSLKHETIFQPTIGCTAKIYENEQKTTNLILEAKTHGVSKFDSLMFGLKYKKYFNDNFFYSVAVRSYDLSVVTTSRLCLLYKKAFKIGVDYDLTEYKTALYLYIDLKGFKFRIPFYTHFYDHKLDSLKDYLLHSVGFVWGTAMAIFSFNYVSKFQGKIKSTKYNKKKVEVIKNAQERHEEQKILLKNRVEMKRANTQQCLNISFAIFTDLKTLSNEGFCSELKQADSISTLKEMENYKDLEKSNKIFDVTTFTEYFSTESELIQQKGPNFGFPGFPAKIACKEITKNKPIMLIKYSIELTKRLKYFWADEAIHIHKDHDLEGYTI